jgi:hypothetical protein
MRGWPKSLCGIGDGQIRRDALLPAEVAIADPNRPKVDTPTAPTTHHTKRPAAAFSVTAAVGQRGDAVRAGERFGIGGW